MDAFPGLAAAFLGCPEQAVEKPGHAAFAPGSFRQDRCCVRAEELASQWLDDQLGALEPLLEHPEEAAEPGLEKLTCLHPFFQHVAGVGCQGHAGRERVAPQARRREPERPGGVVARFQLEDKEQPVDGDEPLVPQVPGEGGPIGMRGEPVAILGLIEDLLQEPLYRLAGLVAQLLGDARLLQAGFVNDLGEGRHAGWAGQGEKQQERPGNFPAAPPARVDWDNNLRVGPGRVGYQEAQLDAVGEQAEALAGGQQDALCNPQMTETIGPAALRWRVEVFIEQGGPDTQLALAIGGREEVAAGLEVFAGLNRVGRIDLTVPHELDDRLDDLVADAQGAAAGGQLAEVAAVDLPPLAELLALLASRLGEELAIGELFLQLKSYERLGKRWPLELAVGEIKRHCQPPGSA